METVDDPYPVQKRFSVQVLVKAEANEFASVCVLEVLQEVCERCSNLPLFSTRLQVRSQMLWFSSQVCEFLSPQAG